MTMTSGRRTAPVLLLALLATGCDDVLTAFPSESSWLVATWVTRLSDAWGVLLGAALAAQAFGICALRVALRAPGETTAATATTASRKHEDAAALAGRQNGDWPPVAPYTSPVTNLASFDARNTNSGAISTG